MVRPATAVRLSAEEENVLKQHLRSGASEQRLVERARIVLLASQGHGSGEIATILKTRPARVSKWRQRFARFGLGGLEDAERQAPPL